MPDAPEIYETCRDACVRIDTLGGDCGSGFIVRHPTETSPEHGDNRFVVTAGHLFEYPHEITTPAVMGSTPSSVVLDSIVLDEASATTMEIRIQVLRDFGDTAGTAITLSDVTITSYISWVPAAPLALVNDSSAFWPDNFSGLTVTPSYSSSEWQDNTGFTTILTSNPSAHAPTLSLMCTGTFAYFTVSFNVVQDGVASSVRVAAHVASPLTPRTAFVHLSNVNQTGRAAILPARLIAIDGRNDMALLRVNNRDFSTYYDLSEHAYVELESGERDTRIGEPVHIVGDSLCADYASISSGVVRDPKHFGEDGVILESLLVDTSAQSGNSGSMMVNDRARVVGMLTFSFVEDDSNGDLHGLETMGGGPTRFMLHEMLQQVVPRYDAALSTSDSNAYEPELIVFRKPFLGITLQLNSISEWFNMPTELLNDLAGFEVASVEGTFVSNSSTVSTTTTVGASYTDVAHTPSSASYTGHSGSWQHLNFSSNVYSGDTLNAVSVKLHSLATENADMYLELYVESVSQHGAGSSASGNGQHLSSLAVSSQHVILTPTNHPTATDVSFEFNPAVVIDAAKFYYIKVKEDASTSTNLDIYLSIPGILGAGIHHGGASGNSGTLQHATVLTRMGVTTYNLATVTPFLDNILSESVIFVRSMHYHDGNAWRTVEFGVAPRQSTLARVLLVADRLATPNAATGHDEFRAHVTYYTLVQGAWVRRTLTNVLLYARDSSGAPVYAYPSLYDRPLLFAPQTARARRPRRAWSPEPGAERVRRLRSFADGAARAGSMIRRPTLTAQTLGGRRARRARADGAAAMI